MSWPSIRLETNSELNHEVSVLLYIILKEIPSLRISPWNLIGDVITEKRITSVTVMTMLMTQPQSS